MSVWWRPCLERLGKFMSSSICVSSHTHTHTHPNGWGWSGTKGVAEMMGGRQRTNALDFNKELSQQRVWLYISDAEVIWDPPAGPELSHGPMGLKTLNGKKKEKRKAGRKKGRKKSSEQNHSCLYTRKKAPAMDWAFSKMTSLHCYSWSLMFTQKKNTLTLYLFHLLHGLKHYRSCYPLLCPL